MRLLNELVLLYHRPFLFCRSWAVVEGLRWVQHGFRRVKLRVRTCALFHQEASCVADSAADVRLWAKDWDQILKTSYSFLDL